MEILSTEGIILNTLPYGDYDVIATVFSRDQGIIKLFIKSALKKQAGCVEELTRAEFVYTVAKSALYSCQEVMLVQSSLRLRQRFGTLEAACDMVKMIQQSQYAQKPAPMLYQLLVNYFNQLPSFVNPAILTISFKLKLLRHEGLFILQKYCKACHKELQAFTFAQGTFFCAQHAPEQGLLFPKEEADALILLGFTQEYAALNLVSLTEEFQAKVHLLFQTLLDL